MKTTERGEIHALLSGYLPWIKEMSLKVRCTKPLASKIAKAIPAPPVIIANNPSMT